MSERKCQKCGEPAVPRFALCRSCYEDMLARELTDGVDAVYGPEPKQVRVVRDDVYGSSAYKLVQADGGFSFVSAEELAALSNRVNAHQVANKKPLSGGSNDYYKVTVARPTSGVEPYTAECNDIIEALQMTYAEGNAFKAIWRHALARRGIGKQGNTQKYEAEKAEFFAKRLVELTNG